MNKENLSNINSQWKLLEDIIKAESSIPAHYCLGNHDVWWSENNKGQAVYGKQYTLDKLSLTKPYYSIEKVAGSLSSLIAYTLTLTILGTLVN